MTSTFDYFSNTKLNPGMTPSILDSQKTRNFGYEIYGSSFAFKEPVAEVNMSQPELVRVDQGEFESARLRKLLLKPYTAVS